MRRRLYDPKLKDLARELRNNSTLGEVLLWQLLKRRQRLGYDFHRQVPIAHWIVDFYCPELKLAVEIDGGSHDLKAAPDQDRQRSLERLGVRFIRFEERYVRENAEGAAEFIDERIREQTR